MRLHLLRHADAENIVTSDLERRLTEKGRRQAEQVAHFLERTGQPLDLILTSPYVRARETARAIHSKFGSSPLLEDERIGCGMSPQTALGILQDHFNAANVLIVGHQPDLMELGATLLSVDGSLVVEFRKASLLTLDLPVCRAGAGVLLSFVAVKQMS